MNNINSTFIENETKKIQSLITKVRRHIHANPEVGADQPGTVEYLVNQFKGMDIKILHGEDHVGLVVDIKGDHDGPTMAFRADTDALEVVESKTPNHIPNKLGFKSQIPSMMHACGHDAHTAILFGLGKLIYENKDKLHGKVRLLFQPGEEGFHGAPRMIEKGYLNDVDVVYALHCFPLLKVGQVGYRKGPMMAAVDPFMVTISGLGGHGSSPETASDQILALCRTISNLQTILTRRISPLDSAVISVGYINAGNRVSCSVLPETAEFGGTVRVFTPEVRSIIKNDFRTICETTVKTVHPNCTVSINYHEGYPVTVNNEQAVKSMTQILSSIIPEKDLFTDQDPMLGSEDFSYMLQRVPGALFLLGVTSSEKDLAQVPSLHSPQFDIDEDALQFGVRVFAEIAFNYYRHST